MKSKKEEPEEAPVNSKKEIYHEAIDAIPRVEMDIPFAFPIPLKNSVFVKQITGAEGERMQKRESGLIIFQQTSLDETVVIPNVAVIMAVGIECSEYLVPGMKIIYNRYAEEKVMIYGDEYLRLNEATDIYAILPPEAYVMPKLKGYRFLFLENLKKQF